MIHEFHAIYEKGLLRPLESLELKEQQLVRLSLDDADVVTSANGRSDFSLAARKKAISEMLAATTDLPSVEQSDTLSGRDHDRILYGSKQ